MKINVQVDGLEQLLERVSSLEKLVGKLVKWTRFEYYENGPKTSEDFQVQVDVNNEISEPEPDKDKGKETSAAIANKDDDKENTGSNDGLTDKKPEKAVTLTCPNFEDDENHIMKHFEGPIIDVENENIEQDDESVASGKNDLLDLVPNPNFNETEIQIQPKNGVDQVQEEDFDGEVISDQHVDDQLLPPNDDENATDDQNPQINDADEDIHIDFEDVGNNEMEIGEVKVIKMEEITEPDNIIDPDPPSSNLRRSVPKNTDNIVANGAAIGDPRLGTCVMNVVIGRVNVDEEIRRVREGIVDEGAIATGHNDTAAMVEDENNVSSTKTCSRKKRKRSVILRPKRRRGDTSINYRTLAGLVDPTKTQLDNKNVELKPQTKKLQKNKTKTRPPPPVGSKYSKYSRPMWCDLCQKYFHGHQGTMNRHNNRVHLNLKPFECSECELAFGSNWELVRHIKVRHTNNGTAD